MFLRSQVCWFALPGGRLMTMMPSSITDLGRKAIVGHHDPARPSTRPTGVIEKAGASRSMSSNYGDA
jgi:hypothetical protein